jgi:hypothetical protein
MRKRRHCIDLGQLDRWQRGKIAHHLSCGERIISRLRVAQKNGDIPKFPFLRVGSLVPSVSTKSYSTIDVGLDRGGCIAPQFFHRAMPTHGCLLEADARRTVLGNKQGEENENGNPRRGCEYAGSGRGPRCDDGAYAHMRELRITNGRSNIGNHGKAALPQKKIDKGSKQPISDQAAGRHPPKTRVQ